MKGKFGRGVREESPGDGVEDVRGCGTAGPRRGVCGAVEITKSYPTYEQVSSAIRRG